MKQSVKELNNDFLLEGVKEKGAMRKTDQVAFFLSSICYFLRIKGVFQYRNISDLWNVLGVYQKY